MLAGQPESAQLCYQWDRFSSPKGSVLLKVGKFVIVGGLNAIIKGLYVAMSNRAGFHTQSGRMGFIKNGVFLVQFINIGILIPLAGFNASQQKSQLVKSFFSGDYRELNNEWISDIGVLFTVTMLITTTLIPFIGFFCGLGCRSCKHARD